MNDPHNPTPEQMIDILSNWALQPIATVNKAIAWALPILRASLATPKDRQSVADWLDENAATYIDQNGFPAHQSRRAAMMLRISTNGPKVGDECQRCRTKIVGICPPVLYNAWICYSCQEDPDRVEPKQFKMRTELLRIRAALGLPLDATESEIVSRIRSLEQSAREKETPPKWMPIADAIAKLTPPSDREQFAEDLLAFAKEIDATLPPTPARLSIMGKAMCRAASMLSEPMPMGLPEAAAIATVLNETREILGAEDGTPTPEAARRMVAQLDSLRASPRRLVLSAIRTTISDWHEAEGIEAARETASVQHRERAQERTMTLFRVLGLFRVANWRSSASRDPSMVTEHVNLEDMPF